MSPLSVSLKENATIKDALAVINQNRIVLVFDENDRLLGTITDGDIRRALLRGLSLDDPVRTVYNPDPITCSIHDSREKVLRTAIDNEVFQIPIVDDSGKVVTVEIMENLLRPTLYPNKVVIMAGGLGSRLRPLTNSTPKPLLEIEHKPILEKIIIDFVRQGFKNFILCVNYKAEMIEDYFKDGSRFNADITYVKEERRLGTAGPLALLKGLLDEPFFVMNGDILTNLDFSQMIKHHITQNAVATMGVREYEVQVPYGVIQVEGNRITGIDEKPLHTFYVSSGIYVLDPESLAYIPDDTFFDMPELFERLIEAGKHCIPYLIREYWLDIGNINDFKKANSDSEIARIMANYRHKDRD